MSTFWPSTPMAVIAISVPRTIHAGLPENGSRSATTSATASSPRTTRRRANRRSSRWVATRSIVRTRLLSLDTATSVAPKGPIVPGLAPVERSDQLRVARLDAPPLHLARRRDVAVLLVEPAREERELLHRLDLRERAVHLVHLAPDQLQHLGLAGQVGESSKGDAKVLREAGDVVLVDEDERDDELAPVAHHHRVLDVGTELGLVLD